MDFFFDAYLPCGGVGSSEVYSVGTPLFLCHHLYCTPLDFQRMSRTLPRKWVWELDGNEPAGDFLSVLVLPESDSSFHGDGLDVLLTLSYALRGRGRHGHIKIIKTKSRQGAPPLLVRVTNKLRSLSAVVIFA